jgi:hypothetical protein
MLIPIAEQVAADAHAAGFFDASENGVLIYQAGTSLGESDFTGLTAPAISWVKMKCWGIGSCDSRRMGQDWP